MTLQSCWDQLAAFGFETDKGSAHSYIPWYEEALASYRDHPIRLLEVGVMQGYSLMLWAAYFLRSSDIVGVDIRPPDSLSPGATVVVGDATRVETFGGLGDFDIVIDDGSHLADDVAQTFLILRDRVRPGGIYVIEDIQSDHVVDRMQMLDTFTEYDRRAIKGRTDDRLLVWSS